ncbi:hypothetical protein Dsin_010410 [Dipteronia sinensis]|uniref:Uncharacterized protein n=1 Tax=Dipteronia sinensis TaxID=43782 RepID=A0AAE0AT56_9ROSI|nr:hypothetical protein Dsin_010410 [Dipteronia sinensis]
MKGETIKSKRKIEFKEWGSKPLLDFLASIGKDTNQELLQIDVSSLIVEYCNQNNLFHQENKKKIICDSKLEALFRRKSVNINYVHSLLTTHLAEKLDLSKDESGSGSEDVEVVADHVQKCCFAAIVPENVKLVYLRKSLVEKLSMKLDTFEAKVIGSFVRVKSDHTNDYDDLQRNSHLLVQVTGVKRCSSMSSSEILLQLSDMVKEVPISKLSDDDFTKEECEALCRRVKYRWLERPTVWLARESDSLRKQIDQANEKGWKREYPLNKIKLLLNIRTVYVLLHIYFTGDGDTSEAALESTANLSDDDCAKSSEASSDEGEVDWSIDAIRSTMTPTSLETLKRSYGIPKNIVLRLPEKGQLASSPPQGSVTLHSTFFEFGMKLPFHPFLRYMLSHLQCAPAQLSPYHLEAMSEVEKVQMLSLKEAISIGLSHNFKAVCSALDFQERMKSFENDKKILFDQVYKAVEKNSKLQGQLDKEKSMSARLREHIADPKATVTDATSRADGAVARADAAERDNRELRKINKELKDGVTSWEEAAIKQLSSQQKSKR